MSGSSSGDDKVRWQGRMISGVKDMVDWQKSPGYNDYTNFIKQLNEFAKGIHSRGLNKRKYITDQILLDIVILLDQLDQLIDQIKPFEDDKNQRFGNKAFRIW